MTSFHPDRQPVSSDRQPEDVPRSMLTSMNLVVAAMAGALVVLGFLLWLLGARLDTPDTWMLVLLAVVTAAAWGATVVVPVRRGPADTPAPAVPAAVMLRVALLEAPAILGLVLAFLSEPMNLLAYLLPAAFSLLGIWLFARPRVVLERLSRAA